MKINLLRTGIMLALGALISWSPAQAQQSNPAQARNFSPPIQPVRYDQAERPWSRIPLPFIRSRRNRSGRDGVLRSCDAGYSCNSGCNSCQSSCCDDLCCQATDCCGCPFACRIDGSADRQFLCLLGMESWRGISDGTGSNNNGFVTGFNGAAPIP